MKHPSDLVELQTFSSMADAQWAASMLRAHGIESFLHRLDVAGFAGFLGLDSPARLQVMPEDLERAREILEAQSALREDDSCS